MLRYIQRSIGRKLLVAVGLPTLVVALAGVLWLRHEAQAEAPGLEPAFRAAIAGVGRPGVRLERGRPGLRAVEQHRQPPRRRALPQPRAEREAGEVRQLGPQQEQVGGPGRQGQLGVPGAAGHLGGEAGLVQAARQREGERPVGLDDEDA